MPEDHTSPTTVDLESVLKHSHERKRRLLLRERRRNQFLRAALVGIAAGLVAVLFQWSLVAVEALRDGLVQAVQGQPVGWLIMMLFGAGMAGLAGWLTLRFAPEASGSGIPHIKGVLLNLRPIRRRLLPVKFLGGVLALGAGLSLGREGPTVQLGAAVAKVASRLFGVSERHSKTLIASGAGAGLAAAFNAPLAGFLFVLEELQREMSALTYGAALIAAVCADAVTRFLQGQSPSFHVSGFPTPPLASLPLAALLGIVCGFVGMLFNKGLLYTGRAFRKSKLPLPGRTALVGAAAGLIAYFSPTWVGGGHQIAEALMKGEYNASSFVPLLLGFLGLKFVFTLVSYGTGAPGGIFAPMLVIGALIGLLGGQASAAAMPWLGLNPASFSVLGMAALFASVVRAPLTGIVLIVEMTGNLDQLYGLLVASLVAYLVADVLKSKPVYEALLDEDLHARGITAPEQNEALFVDVLIEPGSFFDGKAVRHLRLPEGCLVANIHRNGRDIVPSGNTRVKSGDHVVFIAEAGRNDVFTHLHDAAKGH